MEIITGVERQRRWRDEDKLRVLAEAEQLGARTSEVARRLDINRGLLWYWRRQLRQGRFAVPSAPGPVFLPVQVSDPVPSGPAALAVADANPRIEIMRWTALVCGQFAVLVHRTPEIMLLATNADGTPYPCTTCHPAWPTPLQLVCEQPTKVQAPLADALVADHDTSGHQD